MASQDPASQLDSTPAFLEDVVPKNYDKVYVCRLLAFDENGTGAMVRPTEFISSFLGLIVTF